MLEDSDTQVVAKTQFYEVFNIELSFFLAWISTLNCVDEQTVLNYYRVHAEECALPFQKLFLFLMVTSTGSQKYVRQIRGRVL
jgi:hypothetical protein